MALPLGLGMALYTLTAGAVFPSMVAMVLVLVAGFSLTFLPAWPLLQATSPPVGFRAAFGATRGMRWQLFSVSCMISALASLPAVFKVDTAVGAGLLAILEGIVTCATLMLTTGLTVAAWRHMSGRLAGGLADRDRPR
jgi:hypothetical protein